METKRKVDALIKELGFHYKDYGSLRYGEIYSYLDLNRKRLDKLPIRNREFENLQRVVLAILSYLNVEVVNQPEKIILKKIDKKK